VTQIPFTRQLSEFFQHKGYICENGVWRSQALGINFEIENLYHAIREKEGWLYPDSVVSQLPDVDRNDAHYIQWRVRKFSFDRLSVYLMRHYPQGSILDVGCGNGWMTGRLAKTGFSVCALDLHYDELQQAARVFKETSNGHWLYGDIFKDVLPPDFFNVIVLASSFQYFRDASQLISSLFPLLKSGGEIHIFDTPFYGEKEKHQAIERTRAYYVKLGYPDFSKHYFHRTFDELTAYHYHFLDTANRLFNRTKRLFGQGVSPFPWIVIRKPVTEQLRRETKTS
jgi:Methylase involved in ubiquinone/menaquinone biosynthesis